VLSSRTLMSNWQCILNWSYDIILTEKYSFSCKALGQASLASYSSTDELLGNVSQAKLFILQSQFSLSLNNTGCTVKNNLTHLSSINQLVSGAMIHCLLGETAWLIERVIPNICDVKNSDCVERHWNIYSPTMAGEVQRHVTCQQFVCRQLLQCNVKWH